MLTSNVFLQHVPIPMQTMYCNRRCCKCVYCPLILAWATTVHKFQGFEAGFDKSDMINYIIADINNLKWEQDHPGSAYVVVSRAKTIGTITPDCRNPINSNLFFQGQIGATRFTKGIYKKDGEKTQRVQRREAWVDYLAKRSSDTEMKRGKSSVESAKLFVVGELSANDIPNILEYENRIVTMLTEPNEDWKTRREKYLFIPRSKKK